VEGETDDVDSTQITAGADTAGTGNAEVEVAIKEWIISDPGEVLRTIAECVGGYPHMVGNPFQLTVSQQRTAALVDRDIAGARFPTAPDFLGAGEAGVGVMGEYLAEPLLSQGAQILALDPDPHPVFHSRRAGADRFIDAIHRHDAETATGLWPIGGRITFDPILPLEHLLPFIQVVPGRQIGMITEGGDIDVHRPGGIEQRGADRDLDRSVFNGEPYRAHRVSVISVPTVRVQPPVVITRSV
jgi:hypothetical protein